MLTIYSYALIIQLRSAVTRKTAQMLLIVLRLSSEKVTNRLWAMTKFTVVCGSGEKVVESANVSVDSLLEFVVSHGCSPLSSLKLADGVMTPDSMSLLSAIIPTNLRSLDLSNLGLTCKCVSVLMKRAVRSRIKRLDLSHNPIGDGAVWILLEFIKQMTDLVSLGLAYCEMTSGGVWPICGALALRNFDFLDVSGNLLKSFGAEHIKDLLVRRPKIREIHVDNCQLGPGDVQMVVDASRKCQDSEVISLRGNERIPYQSVPSCVRVDMLPEMK